MSIGDIISDISRSYADEMQKLMLSLGVNEQTVKQFGLTPLHQEVWRNGEKAGEIMVILCDTGISVETRQYLVTPVEAKKEVKNDTPQP